MKRVTIWITVISVLMLLSFLTVQARRHSAGSSSVRNAVAAVTQPVRATAGKAVSRTAPTGREREIVTDYAGAQAHLAAGNEAQPLALAAGDLDGNGAEDVIAAYRSPAGGLIAIHRGLVSRGAAQRSDVPFEPTAEVYSVPVNPQFVAAGDFDGDGRSDVIVTARGSNTLFLLSGDGRGRLGAPTVIELPGAVTAMSAGEINRLDGQPEVVVGVMASGKPQLLIFAAPQGALKGKPETIALTSEAASLTLSRLDDDHLIDIVAGSSRSVQIIHGWEQSQGDASKAVVEQIPLPFRSTALAVGDYSATHRRALALLTEDGTVRMLERTEKQVGKLRTQAWEPTASINSFVPGTGAAGLLVAVPSQEGTGEDLMAGSALSRRLQKLSASGRTNRAALAEAAPEARGAESASAGMRVSESVDLSGETVAALPVRLGNSGTTSLVVLRQNLSKPVLINQAVAEAQTFTVNSSDDSDDDGICDTTKCTLREAIKAANDNLGWVDTIRFSVASVNAGSGIPLINEPVIIDATSLPANATGCDLVAPAVEIDGKGTGRGFVLPGGSTIRGLSLVGFAGDAITLIGFGNNVSYNYIGLKINGSKPAIPNRLDGINITNSSGNVIRGNVISWNGGNGVSITGVVSEFNRIECNRIGTNVGGTVACGNRLSGVFVANGNNTTITGNLISGNGTGVSLTQTLASGNLLIGNKIGTDVSGTQRLSNSYGVFINLASNNTVGGTAVGAGNLISGNDLSGVFIGSLSAGNLVQGNFIGTNMTGTAELYNTGDGVEINNGLNNTIGGLTTLNAGNLISGNRGNGVNITGPSSTANIVQGNRIGTKVGIVPAASNCDVSTAGIPNAWYGVHINASNNLIGGRSDGTGNIIAFNKIGVYVEDGMGNAILRNQIYKNDGLGIDLAPIGVNPNKPTCSTTGPNHRQTYPVLQKITYQYGPLFEDAGTGRPFDTPTAYVYHWALFSCSNTKHRIEFFSNDACGVDDPTCFGEGDTFQKGQLLQVIGGVRTPVKDDEVATDASGLAEFVFITPNALPHGLSATATDEKNNTSEFSFDNYADLTIVKTAPATAPQSMTGCETIPYTFTITNNGPKPVSRVEVVDDLPINPLTGQPLVVPDRDSLRDASCEPSGRRITCIRKMTGNSDSFTIKVRPLLGMDMYKTPGLSNPYDIVNWVAVRNPDPPPTRPEPDSTLIPAADPARRLPDFKQADDRSKNFDSATTRIFASADMSITETHCPTKAVVTGNDLEYTFRVRNSGPSTATQIVVTDKILPGATLSQWNRDKLRTDNPKWDCQVSGDPLNGYVVTCRFIGPEVMLMNGGLVPIIRPNVEEILKITVTPLINGQIRNQAEVDAFEEDCNLPNIAPSTITAKEQIADLAITTLEAAAVGNGSVNTPVNYSVVVLNKPDEVCPTAMPANLNTTATQIALTVSVPPNSEFVSGSVKDDKGNFTGTCGLLGSAVVCNIGSMTLGSKATASFQIKPGKAGSFTSDASVVANEFDPDLSNNNRGPVAVVVRAAADVGVIRLDAPSAVTTGCNFDYQIVVANSGPSAATNVVVNSKLPAGVTAISAALSNPTLGGCAISADKSSVTCAISELKAEGPTSVVGVTVTASASITGAINIPATVKATEPDPNTTNDSANRPATAQKGDTRLLLTLEGGGSTLEFGPVTAGSTPTGNPVTRTFIVENPGCAPATLSRSSLRRIGTDVTNGGIDAAKADDSGNFSVRLIDAINPDDPGRLFNQGDQVTIAGGGRQRFRVAFAPVIPAFAGTNKQLSASQVLPDVLTSQLVLSQPGLADQVTVGLTGRVSSVLQLLSVPSSIAPPDNAIANQAGANDGEASGPVRLISAPTISFPGQAVSGGVGTGLTLMSLNALNGGATSAATAADGPVGFVNEGGGNFRVTTSIYSAGLDVAQAVYQFVDASGKNVDGAVTVPLSSPLSQAQLVRGQTFTMSLRFSGGTSASRITGVCVTVTNSVSSRSGCSQSGAAGATTVSAANYLESLAQESIVAAFGPNLASGTVAASSLPLPTTLNGTSVTITDVSGTERAAPLFFVSPYQVNYQIPPGTASGLARVRIKNASGQEISGMTQVNDVAPGLFTASSSGEGAPAAYYLRVLADGSQRIESVARYNSQTSGFDLLPVNLGPNDEQVFLTLFGTGIRNAGLASVKAKIGGVDAEVLYAGKQSAFVGLDQVNLRVPRGLFGRGDVEVILTVNGRPSNPVRISVR
ncbi:MAG: FG-GAP-like repeat-containing protein [Blastocatellia bacterium]